MTFFKHALEFFKATNLDTSLAKYFDIVSFSKVLPLGEATKLAKCNVIKTTNKPILKHPLVLCLCIS